MDKPRETPEKLAQGASENGDPNGAPAPKGATERPAIIEQLAVINDKTPEDLARLALGSTADETVPTAEGITLFKGERSRQHKASGAAKSLLATRIDRIKNTPLPGTQRPERPDLSADV